MIPAMGSGCTRRAIVTGAAAWSLAGAAAARPTAEVAFGPDPKQRMDVYARPKGEGAPAIFFLPGGGYRNHHRGNAFSLPAFAQRRGMVLAVTDYRRPQAGFEAMMEDAAAALAALHARAAEFGADPRRIIVMGHSAGGHLAALTAIDPVWLAPHGLSPGELKALVLLEPTGTLRQPPGVKKAPGGAFYERLFAPDFGRYALLNRIPVNRPAPPVLVLYGDNNAPMVPSSRDFVTALRAAGKQAEAVRVPGETHNSLMVDIARRGDGAAERIDAFLRRHAV